MEWPTDADHPAAIGPLHTTPLTSKDSPSSLRSVRFSSDVDICPVICRDDMSREEVTTAWISRIDRTESKRDINNTIFLMQSGLGVSLTEMDYFCPRGLEHLVDRTQQKTAVKKSVHIALAMQQLLRKAGTTDPQLIARAYRKYTLGSQYIAYKKALRDQAAVHHAKEAIKEKKARS